MRDLRVIAVVGAGVAVVAVILIIVLAAIQPIPDFADLATSGETGFVAYVQDDGGEPGDVMIVDLGTGEVVEFPVGREGEIAGWDEDGNLVVVQWGPDAERFFLVDPATGEEMGELDVEEGHQYFDRAGAVWIDHEDGRIVLERDLDGGRASFAAPDSYGVNTADPMGAERIVFVDELGRVAVTGPGEDVVPVLVAADALEWRRVAGRDQ